MKILFVILVWITIKKSKCESIVINPIKNGSGLYFDRVGTMKIHIDDWKLVTFKDIGNINTAIQLLESRCRYTRTHCEELEEISSSLKCKKRIKLTERNLERVISLYESLAHLTSTGRSKRGWFDGLGSLLKTVFGTLDNDDAIYYDNVINKVLQDDKEIYTIMKNQVQVTQSAIQNFNNTIKKLTQNENALEKNFLALKDFIANMNSNVSIVDVRSTLNTHFAILDSMTETLIDEINLIVNSILFAKQNVLHPSIISPKGIYHELTSNMKILKQHKEFPVPLNLEDIHMLIDISTLDVFYINFKLVFILNIPLVTPQEFELYHVFPLPVPHSFQDLTYALVQPTKRFIGITTNRHSYVQFNHLEQCKKLSKEHFVCDDVNEYSSMSNPSCESLLMTKVLKQMPKECITKFMYGNVEIWQKLSNNRWIFIYSKPTKITIDCPNKDIKDYQLAETGIITLEKNCKGYANLIQITATSDIITNYTSPNIDIDLTKDNCCNDLKLNNTKHLFTPFHINNIQLDDLNLASVKLHSIEEQINKKEQTQYNLRNNFHIPYLLYTVCFLIMIYLVYRLCKIFKKERQRNDNTHNDSGCCIQIFNQCYTKRNTETAFQPNLELNEIRQMNSDESEGISIRRPLRLKRTPSTDLKYTYNLSN